MIPSYSKRKRKSTEQVVPGAIFSTSHEGAPNILHGGSVSSSAGPGSTSVNPFDNPDYPIPDFQSVYSRMREPHNGLTSSDGRWRFLSHSKCFSGTFAVQWMVDNLGYNRTSAVDAGQRLMDAGIIYHVTHSEPFCDSQLFYRFQEDYDSSILNMKRLWNASTPTRHAVIVSKDLLTKLAFLCEEHRKYVLDNRPDSPPSPKQTLINCSDTKNDKSQNHSANPSRSLTSTAMSPTLSDSVTPTLSDLRMSLPSNSSPILPTTASTSPIIPTTSPFPMHSLSAQPSFMSSIMPLDDDVDYSTLAQSDRFRNYTFAAAELQQLQICSLNHDERIAFFVNIYNALCLHAHVVNGPPNSVLRRYTFFRALSYRVGGLDLTLDDIEHGILRGNKRPPMIRFLQQFRPSDPKCQFVITRRDGRIHFVISAGTRSDPPIRILDGENVQEELHESTVEFLSCTVKVDCEKRIVTLPRILYWYAEDFAKPEKRLLLWVAHYLPIATANQLIELVNADGAAPSITYENFDWANAEARFNASAVRRKRRRLEQERSSSLQNVSTPDLSSRFASYSPMTTPIIFPDSSATRRSLPTLPVIPLAPPNFPRLLIPVENVSDGPLGESDVPAAVRPTDDSITPPSDS